MESSKTNMLIDGFKNHRYFIIILAILWYFFTSTNVFYSKLVCASKLWSLEFAIVTILLLQYLAGCVPYLCSLFLNESSKSIKGLNLNRQDFMVGFFYLLGNLGALLSLASTSISVNQGCHCNYKFIFRRFSENGEEILYFSEKCQFSGKEKQASPAKNEFSRKYDLIAEFCSFAIV